MITDSPTILEALAAELDPVDPHTASFKIATVLAPVAKWAHSIKSWCSFFTFVSGFSGLICFLIWMKDQEEFGYFYNLGMIFWPMMFLFGALPQFIWRRLYQGPLFGWYPNVLANQELVPIKSYMERCANGEIKVKDDNNARVDKNFFENALSILLPSDPELDRTLVKSDYRRRSYRRQLRVESINGSAARVDQFIDDSTQKIVSAEDVSATDVPLVVEQIMQVPEAEPKRTNFCESHEWIAGGTPAQFDAGLAIFLRLVPSHSDAMFTLIMMTARQELRVRRKADSQNEIIRRITNALMNSNLAKRGSSRTNIMKLLNGKHGKADITGYFLGCRN
jgi:Fe-S-cluster formation regulator IscX/YfhJ